MDRIRPNNATTTTVVLQNEAQRQVQHLVLRLRYPDDHHVVNLNGIMNEVFQILQNEMMIWIEQHIDELQQQVLSTCHDRETTLKYILLKILSKKCKRLIEQYKTMMDRNDIIAVNTYLYHLEHEEQEKKVQQQQPYYDGDHQNNRKWKRKNNNNNKRSRSSMF